MATNSRTRRSHPLTAPCRTPDALYEWVRLHANLIVPRTAVCPHHQAPFAYLSHAYFEPATDLVVWAPRGGGKTRLGAVATLLDLLHKPACQVRILGGSLDQSLRMWEHLMPDLLRLVEKDILGKTTSHRVTLRSGSAAAVLTQSQRAVRGLRVQKLRCDEVELFDPAIWQAAQLVTRSQTKPRFTAGVIEAISTLHTPHGLMQRIVDDATTAGTPIIRWCLLDVLEACAPERQCSACDLRDDCRGVAKRRCSGYIAIDDAIRMKRRTSRETWESEMLCLRPSRRNAVFPHFDPAIHVRETIPSTGDYSLALDFGFANPFVCLWLLTTPDRRTFIVDEYVQEHRMMHQHIAEIRSRPWGKVPRIACDPSGAGPNEQTAISNVALLRSNGFKVHYRKSRIVDGLEMIRAALRPAAGDPTLFIHPRCTRLIRAMQSYRYPDTPSETPLKDGQHDHLIDALRYHYVNRTASRLEGPWLY